MKRINHPIDSPWSSAGCFISRHPIITCILLFLFFWTFRSQYYSGDGDQLSRMVEAGIWMVQTELASHAIFQLFYQILHPYNWDGLKVINLVSCLAGVAAIWVLLKYNREYIRTDPIWALGLFASSGLVLYCNGHTEYYTLFLITLFYYGYAGVGYLLGRFSMLHASLAFSAGVWMHLGILFALPSLFVLLLLKRNWKDISPLITGLSPVFLAYFLKTYHSVFGIHIQGLSPSDNFIPLFSDPGGQRFYTMFEWGHLADILYAWTMRSWIFWPAIFWAVYMEGWRSLLRPDRLFLLAYTLCFTLFTLIWHPNLGIHQDWDLFAIEAAPCLLLLLTYLPSFLLHHFCRMSLAVPVTASALIMFSYILQEAHFEKRDYGAVEFYFSSPMSHNITFNGHRKIDPPQLTEREILDPSRLAEKIKKGGDPKTEWLRNQLSTTSQKRLSQWDANTTPSPQLVDALIRDLNRLINGPFLYAENRFDYPSLPEELQKSINQGPVEEEVFPLNRLLLEEIFPGAIAKSQQTIFISPIREGVYSVKVIDSTHMRVHNLFVYVSGDQVTHVPLNTGPDQGKG